MDSSGTESVNLDQDFVSPNQYSVAAIILNWLADANPKEMCIYVLYSFLGSEKPAFCTLEVVGATGLV